MSTDKFHINDAAPGNDTHSNFLRRMGYGDLLNRPGRQEMTIDTASMYKSAAVGQGEALGAGLGAVAGGIGGAEIANAMGGSATAKLLGALTGAGLGGVGGYYAGGLLDKPGEDGISPMLKVRREALTLGGAGLGGLTGYGISKYLVGSKNKTHHLLSALVGAGIGGGAGYLVAGDKQYNDHYKKGLDIAKELGLDEKQHERFSQLYAKNVVNAQPGWWDRNFSYHPNRSLAENWFMATETDPVDRALAELNGDDDPTDLSITKTIGTAVGGGLGGYGVYKGGKKLFWKAMDGTHAAYNHNLRNAIRMGNLDLDALSRGSAPLTPKTIDTLIDSLKGNKANADDILRIISSRGIDINNKQLKNLMTILGVTDDASASKAFTNAPELISAAQDALKHSDDAADWSKYLKFWKLIKPVKSAN